MDNLRTFAACFQNGNWITVAENCVAYLSQGRLHLPDGNGGLRVVESAFGRSLRERAGQIRNRNAWKTQGQGAQFMRGNRRMGSEPEPGDFPITLTSVTRGRVRGEVLYTLETNEISGVFAVDSDGFEQRLFHTADFRLRDLAVHPDGSAIAVSVSHGGMAANIALLNGEGSDFREISEGDSLDLMPRWTPGAGRRLVFQSAGLGRNAAGHASGRGPFAIQQLDTDSGELVCLAEDPASDLLGPQMAADDHLYYVRRPFTKKRSSLNTIETLRETVLFPFHVLFGIFKVLHLLASFYKGKPPDQFASGSRDMAQTLRVWGETIAIDGAVREKPGDQPDVRSLVPSSWELIRQSPEGKEVLADGVSSFDVAPDGSVIYSNGRAVHRIERKGTRRERILVGKMIEQVAAL